MPIKQIYSQIHMVGRKLFSLYIYIYNRVCFVPVPFVQVRAAPIRGGAVQAVLGPRLGAVWLFLGNSREVYERPSGTHVLYLIDSSAQDVHSIKDHSYHPRGSFLFQSICVEQA